MAAKMTPYMAVENEGIIIVHMIGDLVYRMTVSLPPNTFSRLKCRFIIYHHVCGQSEYLYVILGIKIMTICMRHRYTTVTQYSTELISTWEKYILTAFCDVNVQVASIQCNMLMKCY